MREKCRVQQKGPDCGSNLKSATATEDLSGARRGSSVIDRVKSARAAARDDREGAERALAEYITTKYQVRRDRGRHPSEILVVDVLNIYLADRAKDHARPEETRQRVLTLAELLAQPFTLAEVNGNRCRQYVAQRVGQPWKSSKPQRTGRPARLVTGGAARRELEDLALRPSTITARKVCARRSSRLRYRKRQRDAKLG